MPLVERPHVFLEHPNHHFRNLIPFPKPARVRSKSIRCAILEALFEGMARTMCHSGDDVSRMPLAGTEIGLAGNAGAP